MARDQFASGPHVAVCNQNLAAASGTIFTVTGTVKMRNLVGHVTTVIGTATSLQIHAGATVMTASTDITTITTLTLLIRETATNAALTKIASHTHSIHAAPTDSLIGSAGGGTTNIIGTLNASGTGVISWMLEWFPMSVNANVVAAQ